MLIASVYLSMKDPYDSVSIVTRLRSFEVKRTGGEDFFSYYYSFLLWDSFGSFSRLPKQTCKLRL